MERYLKFICIAMEEATIQALSGLILLDFVMM
jgi:hypothetical protein